jgi:hypothetical protein
MEEGELDAPPVRRYFESVIEVNWPMQVSTSMVLVDVATRLREPQSIILYRIAKLWGTNTPICLYCPAPSLINTRRSLLKSRSLQGIDWSDVLLPS